MAQLKEPRKDGSTDVRFKTVGTEHLLFAESNNYETLDNYVRRGLWCDKLTEYGQGRRRRCQKDNGKKAEADPERVPFRCVCLDIEV